MSKAARDEGANGQMVTTQKILIVDDRPENLLALEQVLADCGARLLRATSGQQALAVSLEHELDLALLDVRMPGMDGYELAELLRGDPKTRHLPIVFLTANNTEDEQVFKGYEAGAVDYIVKPYNPTFLRSKVMVLLEMQAQRREIEEQRRQLAALNEELEAFAYSVSHDLRAPLRAIEGFARALVAHAGEALGEEPQAWTARIAGEAERMSTLISDLLTLARVSRSEIAREPVDLGAVAEAVIGRLREGDPGREVELVLGGDLGVQGDPRLLEQVLENLVGNAWKFTRDRAAARIEIGVTRQRDRRAFFVRDNGVGFDPSYAGRIFAPFQRLHCKREYSGSGVGLATVQRVIRRHGGEVWCEAEPGRGATFLFTIPFEGRHG